MLDVGSMIGAVKVAIVLEQAGTRLWTHRHQVMALSGLGYTPLAEAARLALEAVKGTDAEELSREFGGTPDGTLNWHAYMLAMRSMPIYGQRPPTTSLELIPEDEIARSHFADGAAILVPDHGSAPTYINLMVDRRDLRRQLRELRG